ncbi:MAG TPA: phenylalanine--tRNA ligase subunit alpha [bacterium]|nr:phenylalanine--tRNA ligase subunit alpha [bacterium]HOL47314.1 phenylalanine--tRNA ligase subunit alpha [bacterium]HPQ17651.1 phenylalanine--tRNA ligase subunit alpha [bacterium]
MENKRIEEITNELKNDIIKCNDKNTLENIRIKYLGKKGLITGLLKQLGELSPEQRKEFGKAVNILKEEALKIIENKKEELFKREKEELYKKESIDVTLGGYSLFSGNLHPLTKVCKNIIEIFLGLGFSVETGPELELDKYNFKDLNFPDNHPARDMHDTFYINNSILMRTHTSPVQIRAMKKSKPPLKFIVPGKVFRCDSDLSHSPVFHQVEGFWVDEKVTFADLKGILTIFLRKLFEKNLNLRFRPSFFPFTEPSAEVDIECVLCNGNGCNVCKKTGWLEILGCGMIHTNVLKAVNYDTEKYQGFAFGLGIERITMLKHSINNIRLFYENDIRFLKQF